jgi:23S rRNA (cytidine2498-2'-O)-methyltransferase
MLPGAPPDADAVSRSARKLTQAVETFGINLPAGGLALDLGSSPGGWVQVLRRAGMRVMAVDPADLAPAVTADPGVMHRRVKVQKLDLPKVPLVMLTNDLRMVADSSVEAVLRIAPRLVKGAPCIMTLKLPEHGVRDSDVLTILEKALSRLETEFEILGARQLPVNRSEVTVAMRRPSS